MTYDAAMKKMGQRARKARKLLNFPTVKLKTMTEFSDFLVANPESLTYFGSSEGKTAMQVKVVKSSKHEHIIFYDEELLKKFTNNENFMDGTFHSRAAVKGCTQLLTIMGRKNNIVSSVR